MMVGRSGGRRGNGWRLNKFPPNKLKLLTDQRIKIEITGSKKHIPLGGNNGTKSMSYRLWYEFVERVTMVFSVVGLGRSKRKTRSSTACFYTSCSLDSALLSIIMCTVQSTSETSRIRYFPRAAHQSKTKLCRLQYYSRHVPRRDLHSYAPTIVIDVILEITLVIIYIYKYIIIVYLLSSIYSIFTYCQTYKIQLKPWR